MRTITRDIVCALIFSKDGKLFMGRKDPHGGGVYSDCWHIPGGGIESGESKIDALLREVKEETGIVIDRKQISFVDDRGEGTAEKTLKETGEHVIVQMHFFVYRIDLPSVSEKVSVSLNDDLVSSQWFETAALSTLQLTPPSVELFEKLGFLK